MKNLLLVLLHLSILSGYDLLAQVQDETFTTVQKAPKKVKDYEYGPFKFIYPEDWHIRKKVTAKGVIAEGPLHYLHGNKAAKFGFGVSEIPGGDVSLETFMKYMEAEVRKKSKAMMKAANSSEATKKSKEFGVKVKLSDFGRIRGMSQRSLKLLAVG